MGVSKNLNLNVPRLHNRFFQNHISGTKCIFGLGLGQLDSTFKITILGHQAHAATTATRRRLNHDRQTNFLCLCNKYRGSLIIPLIPWNAGHPGVNHGSLGFCFIPHDIDRGIGGANKSNPRLFTGGGKSLIFRQESIAWMDRVGTCFFSRIKNRLDIQIRL